MKHILFIIIFITNLIASNAQVRLPKLISDHMILQRDQPVAIWGWAAANESIQILFDKEVYNTTATSQGDWKIQMQPHAAGGSHTMKIKASNEFVLNDILFGDIWVCSGQSNMELWMGRLKYKYPEEIANANNNQIRQFLVPDQYNFKGPQKDVSAGAWLSVDSKTILDFSGTAYFFAKAINEKLHVPIGIINAALGGSPAQAWISEEGLQRFPTDFNEMQLFKNDQHIQQIESADQKISNAWYQYANTFDEGILQHWSTASFNDQQWNSMQIPGDWTTTALGNTNGVVWFRKTIHVPQQMVGVNAKLELGRIVDADSVFINGNFVGTTGYQYPPRRYELSNNVLHTGENVIAVRVISNTGKGGFVLDKRYELTTSKDTISLVGSWKYKLGIATTALPSATFVRWKPGGLYNAMIAPLTQFAIKGFLWYQGESNASMPNDYGAIMQSLVMDWRAKWNQQNLPFLFVQLPNFMEPTEIPKESQWATIRQEQFKTLALPNTAMAVAIDLGDWNDIHPENKKDVGYRLSLLARKLVYGETKLVAQGPKFKSAEINNHEIIISFSDIGSGLISKDGKALQQFQIAGADKKFVWANASIVNNQVKVWSDQIASPMFVRYAWADNPEGANLYNKEELPTAPFTTIK